MLTHAVLIFAIGAAAAVSLGVADFFGARASKNIGPITAAFAVQVVGTIAICGWYPFSGVGLPSAPFGTWVYALTGAMLIGAGMCTLYLAFEIGPVSLASPLSAAYPLITAAVGVAFFHAALSAAQCVAVLITVFGIMATSGVLGVEKGDRRVSRGPRLALLTTLLWGLAYPLLGQAVNVVGWQAVTLIQFVAMVPVLGLMLVRRRVHEHVTVKSVGAAVRDPFIIAAGLIQMVAVLAINYGYGLDQTAGTIVVATSATYPVITMMLALRHFDERTDKLKLTGAGLTLAGVVSLYLF
jgi:drug/metabolite transporter (DMT)-like permease